MVTRVEAVYVCRGCVGRVGMYVCGQFHSGDLDDQFGLLVCNACEMKIRQGVIKGVERHMRCLVYRGEAPHW